MLVVSLKTNPKIGTFLKQTHTHVYMYIINMYVVIAFPLSRNGHSSGKRKTTFALL